MRGQTRRSPVLVQRAVSEDPRWTRAVGDHLARPRLERWEPIYYLAPVPLAALVPVGVPVRLTKQTK